MCGAVEGLEKEKVEEHGFNEEAAVVWEDLISPGWLQQEKPNDKSEACKPCQAAKIRPHTN